MTGLHFVLDNDQRQLQLSVRALLARGSTADHAALAAGGDDYDLGIWKLIVDMGLVGLTHPVSTGGGGASLEYLCVVLTEMGRSLYSGPFFSSAVLASQALLATDDEARGQEALQRIGEGDCLATVVGLAERDLSAQTSTARISASYASGRWVLNGSATDVWDGDHADLLVVLADGPDGLGCFLVESDRPGVSSRRRPSMDLTRRFADVELNAAEAVPLGAPGVGSAVLEHLLMVAPVCLAAEQVGAMERCLELTLTHTRQRHQFGRAIASFQAVKHQLVNAYLDSEAASCAVLYAAWAIEGAPEEATLMAHVAKSSASEAYYLAACTMIQLLGGVGYTWEHPAHLYLRRAMSSRACFGLPAQHRREMVRIVRQR